MKSNVIGWTTFYNVASIEFSQEFQTEMSNQLKAKFDSLLGISNYAENKKFSLFVGMEDLDLNYENDFAFVTVEIIAPNSFSKTMTAFWKSDDNNRIVKADTVSSENIEFGWCSDFDKEFFLSFAKDNYIKEINDIPLKFEFIADFQLYPDLTIEYVFKTPPTNDELSKIESLLETNAYTSEITEYQGAYYSIFDASSYGIAMDLRVFEQFILSLNSSDFVENIKSITIN